MVKWSPNILKKPPGTLIQGSHFVKLFNSHLCGQYTFYKCLPSYNVVPNHFHATDKQMSEKNTDQYRNVRFLTEKNVNFHLHLMQTDFD